MSSSRRPDALAFLVRLAVFAVVFACVGEVWFRVVMPASQMPAYYQANPMTVNRYSPFGYNAGQFTLGRLCRPGPTWSINDEGWNCAVEYESAAQRGRPLVALFGDSYIEGFSTDPDQHVEAYLPRFLPGSASYAFGLSGWYLEQYVAVSRYARDRFQPDVLVVFVDDGDVRDSLRSNGLISPYLWQIGERDGSFEELSPSAAYQATLKSRLARRSALISYLRCNAKLDLPGMRGPGAQQAVVGTRNPEGGAAASSAADDVRWRTLVPAARFMVERLRADHPGTPIVFAAFGDRYLPVDAVARTPLSPDARAVEAVCGKQDQCAFLDLRSAFSRDWAAHRVRFEAADGAHWNARANRLVARTLAEFISSRRML
jgi:hypothetical protein